LSQGADAERVAGALAGLGLWTRRLVGAHGVALAIREHSAAVDISRIESLPGVDQVFRAEPRCERLAAQAGRPVEISGAVFGGGDPVLLAGPCSAESKAQVREAAAVVAARGARFLRGGAYKPRTSPYAFRGHGRQALTWLRDAADAEGLGVVTEVLSEGDVQAVAEVADLVQIGSRNMQNYALLAAVGRTGRPALLKRGAGATTDAWLLAGEHILAAGAEAVIFCERGIRSFDSRTRNLLDLGAVALLKHVHRQPVVVDPSHAVGRRDLIQPLSCAAIAAGADGLLLEVHPRPCEAMSDGPQALPPHMWEDLVDALGLGLVKV